MSGSDLLAGVLLTVILFFVFDRCVVTDRAVDPAVVEPPDMIGGSELEMLDVAPGSVGPDEFGLVQTNRGFGHRIDAPIGQEFVLICARRFNARAGSGQAASCNWLRCCW